MNDVQLTLTLKSTLMKNHVSYSSYPFSQTSLNGARLILTSSLNLSLTLTQRLDLTFCCNVLLRECFLECLLLDGDLDLEEDICALGGVDLSDPIPPCDVLECDLDPNAVLFFFSTSESELLEL